MLRLLLALAIAATTLSVSTSATLAKTCKTDPVIQDGKPYVSRSLGAFPSSLVEWKRAVRDQFGSEWDTWRRAEDRKIDCQQITISGLGRRWVCTRSARPCSGALGKEEKTKAPFPGRLRRRDRGEAVTQLQQLLADNGYDISPDGVFGRGTERAVRDFQRSKGLRVDGVVGAETWAAL